MFLHQYQTANAISLNHLPRHLRLSLLDSSSLTKRLIAASNNSFEVRVLSQGFARPLVNEAFSLHIAPSSRCLIREVELLVDGEAWVLARSVIPLASLKGSLGFLKKLKNSALGALIFKEPSLKRSQFEIFSGKLSAISHYSQHGEPFVVSRRSIFSLKGQPLLVAETFLPACKL